MLSSLNLFYQYIRQRRSQLVCTVARLLVRVYNDVPELIEVAGSILGSDRPVQQAYLLDFERL